MMKTAMPPTNTWQSEEIFVSATNFFDSLIDGIEQARTSIDMDYYIFDNDSLGQRVIQALQKACQRGVRVRLIMDGIGSSDDALPIIETLHKAGAEVRIFHPHPFSPRLYHWSITQGSLWQKFVFFLFSINHRDHHKLCIIDQQHIWTGSINITAKHLPREQGGEGWHDCAVKLQDIPQGPINQCFNHLWHNASPDHLITHSGRGGKIRSNLSYKLRRMKNRLLLERIANAKQRIWICNAYFVPSSALLRALHKACRNGVDIRLILPAKSDVAIFPLISRSFYKTLLHWGASIYEYQPAILHSKLILVDDACLIGSTNLNHRSYYHDLELDIVLKKNTSIAALEKQWHIDQENAKRIHSDKVFSSPLLYLAARFLRLFRYWA